MAGFNIIATLQLQGPTNVGPVVNAIQNSLKGITANVNITFNPGLNANLTAINQRLATLNNQLQAIAVNATNAAAAVQRLTGAFSGIQQANVRLNTSITQTAPAVQQTSRAIAESVNNMENFGRAAGLAGRRYSAFLLAGGSIVGFVTGIRNAVREAATFEQQMIRLQQVGVGTRSELNSVQTQISNLATNLGVSSRELAQASVLFAAAGVKAKDMAGALEALAKASLSPSFGNMIETVNGMIAISSQFRISMSSMESALGGINAVANEFSVESKDIIEAVTRAGGAFRTAGGTLNEFVATFTSVRSTTRESADAIATGLRTIFSSLQRGKTVEALKDLGVNLRYTRQEAEALGDVGLTEQFVGPYQAVQRLSEALAGLRSTDPRFANIATELGGLRQLSRVLPLLQETARAQEAYNIAQSGQISLEINAQQAQQGTIVRLTKLREEFLALFRTLTNTPAWQGFVTGMFTLASGIIRVTEALTPLMPLLQAFLTIKIGQNIGYLAQGVLGGAAGRGPSNTPPVGPRGYARGGVVPGTGDLDTVPAYLTPGEFVVRKQAAQSIGYNNLHSLNVQKFATGGQAKQASVASGRSFVVGEGTSVGLVARSGQNSIWKGSIDYLDITRRGKAPDPIQDFINDLKNQGVNDKDIPNYIRVRGTVNRSTLVPQRAVEFEQNVVPVITDKINDIFKALPPLKGQVLPTLSHQALSTVVGPVFEGYISRLTGKTGSGPNDNFDFPSMTAGQKQQFSKLFDPPVTSDYIDAKSTSTLSATKDIIKKGLNERIHTTGSFVKKALGGLIQPFANGGSARGTDVVPAVLTPGEFIMSRDAVSRVGLSNLEYMNSTGKARGFASGGLVQHFATGGQAAPNTIGFEQFIQQAQIGGPQALETARRRLLDSIIQQHQTADRTLSYDQARQKASEELKNIEDRMLDVNRRIQRALELEVQAAESRARADRARELSAKAAQQGNLTRAARLEAISLNYESREAAQRATIRELRDPSAQILLDRNRQPAGLAGETQQRIENGNITQGTLFQRSRRFLYERAARIGTTGALLALPYAAQAAEQFGGGDAASAIQGGPAGEAAFRRGRIVSGGLQGAATGAAIGSIFGPWGLAIGAAVGGIKGLADASSEAGKQIRDAKIAESMAALITQLQQIASGATEPTIDVVAGARRNLLRTNTEILERTAESNEPWYNRSPFSGRPLQGSPFGVLGNQGTAFYQASQRSVREEFGPQLPGIVGSLNRFAAQTGTANPTLGGGDAAQQRETLDSLTRSFAEGGGGLNRELLLIVANLRRIPVHEVEREFRAVIEQAARGERVRIAERRSTQATGNIATYFEAFVRSIEQATQSLARLENQTRALSDDFSGTVSAIRLPTHRNVELGGPDTPRFLQTVNSITSPFGSGAGLLGGGELRSSALAANSIRQLLPQAITTGLSRGPLDEHSLSDQVRTILQEGTAGQGNQQELQRYISIAVDNLRKESLEQISSQSAGDIGKLADKIFGQIGNPIQEALNKIAKEIDTVGSQFVEGLSEYGQRLARAGAQQDTVADTRVQRDRLQARLFAESRGEFGQGAELRYFSLQQAQAGLQSRQERLTGFAGERANDPEAINEAINITRQRLSTAVTTRDRLASNLSPDNRQAFQNAALAVTTLQGRANNLSQALQNLANVTERNATVQERLSVLDRDRESRLGFAERLLTAGPDEVNRLTRGGILAQGGIEQGTLAHLPQQQRQEAVEFLRSAGDAIIPGLGNGRLTAREHLNQLALGTFPELGQAPEQRQERTALEGQLLANSDTAVRAGELIAGQTRSAADTFFQRLTTVHNTLFTELRNNQIIMSQFLIGSQRATAVVERRDLAPQERNAAVLSGFGINRQSQVEQIRANLPNIQRVIADVNRERSFIQQARNYTTGQAGADLENIIGQGDTGFTVGDGRVNFTNDRTATALRGRLQSVTGVNPDQAERLFTNLTRNATRNISQAGSLTGANRRAFTEAFSTTVEQHFLEQAARVRAGVSEENLRGVSNLFGRGQALEGRTPNQFRDFISSLSPEQQNVFSEQGLSRFTQTQPLEGLNARITQADATVQRLTESFEQLNAQVSQINQARTGAGYATGGSVFRPRGSDTVPAMLTPGEFVVNARAAQEHLPLLRAINGNNRTVHAAGGGLVNYLAEGGELAGGSGLLASIFWRLWRNRVAEQQARTPSVTVTDPWNTLPEQSATIRPPEPLPVRRNQIRANSLRPRQLPSQLQTTIDFVPPRFGNELPPVGTGVNPNYETIDQAAERILRGGW
jgi:TP901 family phage tail tape measure protein